MSLFNQADAKIFLHRDIQRKPSRKEQRVGSMARSHILQLLLLPPCLTLRCYSGLDTNYEVIQPPPRVIDIVPRMWIAGVSARELHAFASKPILSLPLGLTQPCQTQASILIRANTLVREANIRGKATRGCSTLVRESSTRAWTGSSTRITQCPAEVDLVGRGWRHVCQPTAPSGRQMKG